MADEAPNIPTLRMLYQHYSGEVFILWGNAQHRKTKQWILILSSVVDGHTEWIELDNFFDPNPNTGVPRFQLVKPK